MTVQTPNEQIHVRSYFGCSRREAVHKVRATDFDKEAGLIFNQPPPPRKKRGGGCERITGVVQALQSAFEIWNDKLTEIWSLITTTPQEFRGGDIWNAIVGINEGLKAVGYGLLVLFFAMGIFQSAASFRDLQRPEYALRHFIRFIAAKVAVSSAMEIMTVVFSICGGIVQSVMSGMGGMVAAGVTIPQEMVDAIENVGFMPASRSGW